MSARPLLDDCFLHDKDRLRHHEALLSGLMELIREGLGLVELS